MAKAKMATDIPKSITMPDTVETRLGTLRFTDGFPDDATVEKVFDNLDFQHAVQAFLTSMPAASLAAIRKAAARLRAGQPDGDHLRVLMDSRSLYLTANTESIYAMAWLESQERPHRSQSPPNTLGLVDDSGSATSPTSGSPDPTRGRAASSCSSLLISQARRPRATTRSSPEPSTTGSGPVAFK